MGSRTPAAVPAGHPHPGSVRRASEDVESRGSILGLCRFKRGLYTKFCCSLGLLSCVAAHRSGHPRCLVVSRPGRHRSAHGPVGPASPATHSRTSAPPGNQWRCDAPCRSPTSVCLRAPCLHRGGVGRPSSRRESSDDEEWVDPQLPSELKRPGGDNSGDGGSSSSEEEDYLDPPSDDDGEQGPSDAQDQQLAVFLTATLLRLLV